MNVDVRLQLSLGATPETLKWLRLHPPGQLQRPKGNPDLALLCRLETRFPPAGQAASSAFAPTLESVLLLESDERVVAFLREPKPGTLASAQRGESLRGTLSQPPVAESLRQGQPGARRRFRICCFNDEFTWDAHVAAVGWEQVAAPNLPVALCSLDDTTVVREVPVNADPHVAARDLASVLVITMDHEELVSAAETVSNDHNLMALTSDLWLEHWGEAALRPDEPHPQPDIAVLIGHGSPGAIERQRAVNDTESILAQLRGLGAGIVVLAACNSATPTVDYPFGLAGELVSRGVPAVIGYDGEENIATTTSLRALVQRILMADQAGQPIDFAVHGVDTGLLRFYAATNWFDTGGLLRRPLRPAVEMGTPPVVARPNTEPFELSIDGPITGTAVVADTGDAVVLGGGARLVCGLANPAFETFHWWTAIELGSPVNVLAVRRAGPVLELLTTDVLSGQASLVRTDHGGEFDKSGARFTAAAGAAVPGGFVAVSEGRLVTVGNVPPLEPLLQLRPNGPWRDIDAATAYPTSRFDGVLRYGILVAAISGEDLYAMRSMDGGPGALSELRHANLGRTLSSVRVVREYPSGSSTPPDHIVAVTSLRTRITWRWADLTPYRP